MEYFTQIPSIVGAITVCCDETSVHGVWLAGQKYFARTAEETMERKDDLPLLLEVKQWFARYFKGENPPITFLLAPKGKEFQQIVLSILLDIPYGQVMTYGAIAKEVAKRLGRERMSAQAVGGAVGHNPISILIPCHRVVGSNKSLTGYAGGIETKIKLLKLEGAFTEEYFIPAKGTAL